VIRPAINRPLELVARARRSMHAHQRLAGGRPWNLDVVERESAETAGLVEAETYAISLTRKILSGK
jgi:hypothetical protein